MLSMFAEAAKCTSDGISWPGAVAFLGMCALIAVIAWAALRD